MVNTKFWNDNWIRKIDPLDRYLFLYLLTNEHTNISGIYELPLATLAFESGIKEKILKQTTLPKLEPKAFYLDGWIFIPNFQKHQSNVSEKIKKGIEIEMKKIPNHILEAIKKVISRYSIDTVCIQSVLFNYNYNYNNNINSGKKNLSKDMNLVKNKIFSLREEIKKLENSPRRDMNIIALYFEYRKPDLQNYEQYSLALKRHLKAAGQLVSFNNNQIIKAIDYAKKKYEDIYTLETLIKILTK